MIDVATHLVLLFAACVEDGSTFTVVGEAPVTPPVRARIVVEVEDGRAAPDRRMPLPVRVVVTASDGSHPDGSGRGVYSDGRFFAEAGFSVEVPPGRTDDRPAQRAGLRAAGDGRGGKGGARVRSGPG